MANEKRDPAVIVVPRTGGDIIVRQFRPSDAPQIHAMLFEGLVYGPESPRNTALRRSLTSPRAYLAYTAFALGLTTLSCSRRDLRLAGGTLCTVSLLFMLYLWRAINNLFVNFCIGARKTDMADIAKSYEIPDDISAEQGPGGFFVAAIESGEESEVVGYLGLDYHANDDPTSGELRRMIVSARHRRRKIGSLLINAAMAHARSRSPPLLTIDLETTEFQPGAQKLYTRHGFAVVGTRVVSVGVFQATIFRFRRKVAE
ncbi:acyl-CoA N-acyltransferase [Roridomyces roridus]|uniref:Acyl-CoA N-acyltransferase n=1 Tax=Roridomyces roridus TaxID=1738132 RepID=A0AAD7B855_9AGAR|nr:acyl-CoA N-acyltransferase [Roridomyces roridus]